jgi:hypothetical protein
LPARNQVPVNGEDLRYFSIGLNTRLTDVHGELILQINVDITTFNG